MGTASMIARAEVRHRWGSLLGVALLVAIVTAAVLTALVGAHRSSTAVERFRDATGASDLEYQSDTLEASEEMLATAEAEPSVDSAGLRYLVNVWPTDGSNDIALMTDPDGVYSTTIERPMVLEGRMPSPDAPDEVLLNELAADVTGLDVGDHIDAGTWSEQDLEDLFASDAFPGFNGPHLDLTVVGIGRTADGLAASIRRTGPYAIASPAFLAAHADVGAWPPAVLVRLHPGASSADLDRAISAVQLAQTGDLAPGGFHTASTTAADVYLDTANTATDSLVVGLLLFAAAAALSGGLAVGQAVQRQLAGSVTPSTTLAALGSTRREIALTRSVPVALVAVAGVVVGVAGAVAASPLLPIGLVRRAEIDPGVWVDPLVLAVGGAVIVALVWGWALLVARRQTHAATEASSVRRTPLAARLAARAGASPALAAGLRMAGDRGRGPNSVPVRSAFVGVALAVTGLLAAGVVSVSYRELVSAPAHWGVPWQSAPDYFGDTEMSDLEAQVMADPRIPTLAVYSTGTLVLDGQAITGAAMVAEKGDMALSIVDGRLPTTPTEVAIGAKTLDLLGLSVGDTTSALPGDGGDPVPLTIVGTAVIPATEEYVNGAGAILTGEGLARFGNDVVDTPVFGFAPGADVATVEAGLAADYGFDFNLFTEPNPQGAVTSLTEPRDIALALAGFLAVLALIGMMHVLVVSTRRRRRDLGVLRAMGLRGRQAQRAVVVEALALTVAGLVVGIPAGLIVGRTAWQALVANLGALADAQWPWYLLVGVVPVVALIAAALAWWPAHRVRVISPAVSLRAE